MMAALYAIRVKGHLDSAWQEWLDGLQISHEANGTTVLTGMIVDQAALYSLINKLAHLGLYLLSVQVVNEL